MKKILHRPTLKLAIGMVITFVLFTGCSKEENTVNSDKVAKVQVFVSGVENVETGALKASSAKKATSNKSALSRQTVSIRMDNEYYMQATLSRKQRTDQASDVAGLSRANVAKTAGTTFKAAANPLPTGVTYGVVVYDADGNYVDHTDYTVGGSTPEPFELVADQSYTFITYSLNNSDPLPAAGTAPLSATKIEGIAGTADLLYTRIDQVVTGGQNTLNITLKHLFSEITTAIDGSQIGSIEVADDFYLAPHYDQADLEFTDGTLTYHNLSTTGSAVQLGAVGSTSITSLPTIVATPATANGVLKIGAIKIGDVIKNNVEIGGITIIPGERYDLNITIKKHPQDIGGLIWAEGDLIYDSGTDVYSFSQNPGDGNYFPFGHLYPYGDGREFDRAAANLGDPCALVMDGNQWRTPTKEDFDILRSEDDISEPRTINGINGAWYPTIDEEGLFFPETGRKTPSNPSAIGQPREGWRWSTTPLWILWAGTHPETGNWYSVVSNRDGGFSTVDWGMKIRCVRDLN
ncbi:fimbrillin family protein [Sphingobacterium haloxyli]|uniref:Fibrobacter succinogenes major paralogous domain-containing protein n=1 Tax=Sphingobacterium haloxyli TaxID=2100533 RepID=A0A2S9J9C2_9SPHI|nr:fimbrillin family protein [Sphingobacterium haloxyli]PRD49371.1 hypothetical protein C5745_01765 [Sphingobacterium haloxyli]